MWFINLLKQILRWLGVDIPEPVPVPPDPLPPGPQPDPGPTPNPDPTPDPTPTPWGDIKVFNAIPALDDPDNCYFTGCRVEGGMQFGTYKDGSYKSHIKDIGGNILHTFTAESCFMILPFNNGYNMTQEKGEHGIYRLVGGRWKGVYKRPNWDLMLEMCKHGNYLYASGQKWGVREDPAGIVKSVDGIVWEDWLINKYEYRFYGMCSHTDGALWTAATSSGADWGANDCRPAVFRNTEKIWEDYDHINSGNWAIESWHNDIWTGRCGDCAVVRYSDKKEVLTMPGYESIHDFAVDKKTDTLMAFCNKKGDSGAIVKGTKDGNNWYTVDEGFSVPLLFDGWWDETEQTIYLAAGKFAGQGKVYKGIR